jgi:hypothetical protein
MTPNQPIHAAGMRKLQIVAAPRAFPLVEAVVPAVVPVAAVAIPHPAVVESIVAPRAVITVIVKASPGALSVKMLPTISSIFALSDFLALTSRCLTASSVASIASAISLTDCPPR